MNRFTISAFALALLGAPAPAQEPASIHLVACAPGYPGSTAQAQPTMDEFADMLAASLDVEAGTVSAEYQETEAGGLERLRAPDTTLALVPLPFFLKYEADLELEPLVQVVGTNGSATETWSLVAPSGRVGTAADLEGWTVVGVPTYAPAFVRGALLSHWGEVPDSVDLQFSRRVLSGVRRAAAGENVAVILDEAQTTALAALPNADQLEVVTTGPPVLGGLVVAVGGRLEPNRLGTIRAGLLRLHEAEDFARVLSTVRLQRFEPIDAAALAELRTAYQSGQ